MAETASAAMRKEALDPAYLTWSSQQVADWMADLGYPQYRECFTTNGIDGRKLILVDASHLPSLGITDFEHIKHISRSVRDLLAIEEPYWNRSISLPHREMTGMYLERKSITGPKADSLTYGKYLKELKKEELAKNGTKR
ncbi:sterile alpha motif domain-containing protein 15-like [Patiria miniata]|uniref:SAM domain-containing protein n=1 Tax=Patiria miniata TaxID=46514 RepID=A0A914BAV1_PATMI|nr:sterile alpha motif domain-containing protein 15-like [Patiria miniata]